MSACEPAERWVAIPHEISELDHARFYSSHVYGALHALVSLKGTQSLAGLSERLQMPVEMLAPMLDFLVAKGVIKKQGERLVPGPHVMHLDKKSSLIAQHHGNWRFHAVQSFHRPQPEATHYSGIVTTSFQVVAKMRGDFVRALERHAQFIQDSKEKEAFVYAFDFYLF